MSHAAVWDDACDWPRRLLHVPSMTSYPWEPDDSYNGYMRPSYNALSYTWGRWALRNDQKPNVKSLEVKGVPWCIPRIDPGHFETSELHAVIQRASVGSSSNPTDFLWIDIACIDQDPESKDNAREVGRQATIFRSANKVFAWLTSFQNSRSFVDWVNLRFILHQSFQLPLVATSQQLEYFQLPINPNAKAKLIEQARQLSLDPWFSSMWTLQEAFLRSDAIVLCKYNTADLNDDVSTFSEAFSWMSDLARDRQRLARDGDVSQPPEGNITGFSIVFAGNFTHNRNMNINVPTAYRLPRNPFHIMTSYKSRKTSRDEDRIYAIMQVFDLRLGKSDPNAIGARFSFSELEKQLHMALLIKYPIASQLTIQPSSCTHGHGWIPQPGAVVSIAGDDFWRNIQQGGVVKDMVKLSMREQDGSLWGYFKGPIVPLKALSGLYPRLTFHLDERLHTQMQAATQANLSDAAKTTATRKRKMAETQPDHMSQDGSALTTDLQALEVEIARQRLRQSRNWPFVLPGVETDIVLDWIHEKFPNLSILLLGITNKPGAFSVLTVVYGLCLKPCSCERDIQCYERIGTLTFAESPGFQETVANTIKACSGNGWVREGEGIFG